MRPSVSRDGRLVAHYWMTPEEWRLGVTRIGERLPSWSLPLRPTHAGRIVRWSPVAESLAFIDGHGGAWNIWTQPLDGGSPRKLTHFTDGRIATFDWSRDGSKLAWTRINEVRDVVVVELGAPAARN
jgi:Tol biopolymer transport system component